MNNKKPETKAQEKISTQWIIDPKKLSEEEMRELGNKIIKKYARAFKSLASK